MIEITYHCPKCHIGIMKGIGFLGASKPEFYSCNRCRYNETNNFNTHEWNVLKGG